MKKIIIIIYFFASYILLPTAFIIQMIVIEYLTTFQNILYIAVVGIIVEGSKRLCVKYKDTRDFPMSLETKVGKYLDDHVSTVFTVIFIVAIIIKLMVKNTLKY